MVFPISELPSRGVGVKQQPQQRKTELGMS